MSDVTFQEDSEGGGDAATDATVAITGAVTAIPEDDEAEVDGNENPTTVDDDEEEGDDDSDRPEDSSEDDTRNPLTLPSEGLLRTIAVANRPVNGTTQSHLGIVPESGNGAEVAGLHGFSWQRQQQRHILDDSQLDEIVAPQHCRRRLNIGTLSQLPVEVIVLVMAYQPLTDLLYFRGSCSKLNGIFYGSAMDNLSETLVPPIGSWTLIDASAKKRNLLRLVRYKRNLQAQRQMRKTLKERARLGGGQDNSLQIDFTIFSQPKPRTVLRPPSPTTHNLIIASSAANAATDIPLLDAPVTAAFVVVPENAAPASNTMNISSLNAVDSNNPNEVVLFSTNNTGGPSGNQLPAMQHAQQPVVVVGGGGGVAPSSSSPARPAAINSSKTTSLRQLLMSFMPQQEPLTGPTAVQVVKAWLDELAMQRRVRQNISRALFDTVVIEKQSHAAPLLLPGGVMCFSRWHLVAVYVRTCDSDSMGRPIPNTAKWIKTGYLGSHTETITMMRYDAFQNAIFTASFDSTIRRWAVRDDSPIVGVGGKPSTQQGLFRCLASYRVMINGLPASNFSVFSFDIAHLRDYKWATEDKKDKLRIHAEQAAAAGTSTGALPSQPPGASTAPPVLELLNESSSLICCGSEWGYVALMHVDRRHSTTLGLCGASDSRVRQVRFVNKRPFSDFIVSEAATDEFVEGISAPAYVGTSSGFSLRNPSNCGIPISRTVPLTDFTTVPYISPECPPTGTVQAGTVHIVASTFTGVVIMSHRIYRRVVEMYKEDGRATTIRKGYHYFSTSLQMETLQIINEIALFVDSPKMWWHRPPPRTEELPPHFLAADATRRAATSNVQTISDETSEAHPFLVRPLVLLVYRRERSALLHLDESPQPPASPHLANQSRPPPYKSLQLPQQTSGATCGKISPAHAVIAIGTEDGRIMIVAPMLGRIHKRTASSQSQPDRDAFADVTNDLHDPTLTLPPGANFSPLETGDEDNTSSAETLSFNNYNLDFFGHLIGDCPLVKALQSPSQTRSVAEPFVVATMSQSFANPVVNVDIDGWKLSAIDTHATVLVFDLFAEALLVHLALLPSPSQINLCSASLIRKIVDIDCLARPNNPRHIVWSNGTLLVTPLPVTSHSVIADFSGLFHHADYSGAVEAALEKISSIMMGEEEWEGTAAATIPEPRVSLVPVGGKWADSSTWLKLNFDQVKKSANNIYHLAADPSMTAWMLRRVQMQRFPALFHILYICSPPVALLIICAFVAVLAARMDNIISIPFAGVFGLHFSQLPHYFGINLYSYKPLMVHHSGPSFVIRVIADISYLIVFPVIFILRQDTTVFSQASWVLLSAPLLLAVILAFSAARMEDIYEQRHRVALDPPTAAKRYRDVAIVQFLQTVGITAFIVMFAAYFDDPSQSNSLATDKLSIYVVFAPVWAFIAAYMLHVHTLISYNPDPNRPMLSLVLYNIAVVGLHIIYLAVTFAPPYMFCLKYENLYACSTWKPAVVSNSTFSNSTAANMTMTLQPLGNSTGNGNATAAVIAAIVHSAPRCGVLEHIPLLVVVAPVLVALFVVAVFACTNVVVHVQHIRRGIP